MMVRSQDGWKIETIGPVSVEIPVDWDMVTLGDVSDNSGQYGANESAQEFDENEFRYIRITDISESGILINQNKQSIPIEGNEKYRLQEGDLLFARTGSVGRSYLYSEDDSDVPCAFAGYLIRYDINKEINTEYLRQYTNSKYFDKWVDSIARSTTLANINASEYSTLDIPYPPLPEQQRIADILSTVDEQIQQTEEAIEKTRELKRGVVQDLIFYGPDHQDTQTVQLGPATTEIAASWDVSSVGDVATQVQYGSSESLSQEGEYPVFRMNNIEDGKMVASPMKYSELSPEQAQKYSVEKGDILFNRTNSIELVGKCGIFDLDGEFVFASYLIRIQTTDEMNPYFLNYYLNSQIGQGILEAYATRGASQANINATSLKNVNVPLPPRDVQDKIVTQIQTIEKKIEEEQETKSELKNLKRGLMQDLLTGQRRVDA